MRRTSSIDTTRPDGPTGTIVVDGRARDLLTTPAGAAVPVAEARLWARLDAAARTLLEIRTVPEHSALQRLLGCVVGPGFRARLDEVVPELRDQRALLFLLLDDAPGAVLVSGYAIQRAGPVVVRDEGALVPRVDLCAGWARDATIMTAVRVSGSVPTAFGPPAPALEPDDDPLAWHEVAPLPPDGMRRRRRIDVAAAPEGAGPLHPVGAFFRDSHMDRDGRETVVHEYVVEVTVDAAARTVVAIEATADVLPWFECPSAVASAGRLVGRPLADLRPWVRRELVGTTTCTHLNDTLRGLADVETLLDWLPGRAPQASSL